ncbi:cytochrome P450 4C1-like [Diachasmimorpha longicaudata]|uniref:cytochrome P450 4C1-like n=1 Tax=Diachasmimorpha longicaudata TaxID=58733 RepID=UPI0030B8EACD
MGWIFLATNSAVSFLNMLSLGGLVATIVVLSIIRYWKDINEFMKVRRELLRCSSSLPGPPRIPFFGNAHQFIDAAKAVLILNQMSRDMNAKTFVIWLGPMMKVVVTDPRDYEIIMASAKASEKDKVYDFMGPAVVNSLINGGGPTYRAHKKLVVPLINGGKLLPEHIKQFNLHTKIMVKNMAERIGTGQYDIHDTIVPCVADIVFETIFGVPGVAQQGKRNILVDESERLLHLIYKRILTFWLWPSMIFFRTSTGKQLSQIVAQSHRFVDDIISKKKLELMEMMRQGIEPDLKKSAVLDQVLSHMLKTKSWTDEEMRYEMVTLFIGSHDTIAGMSCFLALALAMHPDIQKKVRDELQEVVGASDFTEENIANMKYLDMVVKETIRLFPVGPVLGRQMTGDLKLATCTLPKGASIFMLPYITHRDPMYWVEPEKFMPERFSAENSVGRHPWAYVPFSGGIRSCPGSKYGMICIKTIICQMLRHYELDTTVAYENLHLHAHISTRCVDGYPIILKKLK